MLMNTEEKIVALQVGVVGPQWANSLSGKQERYISVKEEREPSYWAKKF